MKFFYLLVLAIVIFSSSCKSLNSEGVKIYDITKSSFKGYIYQLENNTDKTIYFYGLRFNLPWIFLDINQNNKWSDYAETHYSDDLYIYELPPGARMEFMFPWLDYKQLKLKQGENRKVRIKFPFVFDKTTIEPIPDEKNNIEWLFAYGEFSMSPLYDKNTESSEQNDNPTDVE